MPEAVKFTEEELKQVQDIQQSYANVQNQFGQLKLAQIKLDEDDVQLEENLDHLDLESISGLGKEHVEITETLERKWIEWAK